ncbi:MULTISPECIES: hypothetical protein [Ferrimonas]|uniref:hypothetical protein n=1 Tax=Ferrimonas TaxID=44011 RepID=UPI0004200B5C|nr:MULTISPECIES: hypothetical protein [Ferrimonas]USD36473.1 hypothetical protein J8Z22_15830 [Ferrimonas sp. SCSIO 43195]
MTSTQPDKSPRKKMSGSKLWQRNRYALPDRLFYPIITIIVAALIIIALFSNLL